MTLAVLQKVFFSLTITEFNEYKNLFLEYLSVSIVAFYKSVIIIELFFCPLLRSNCAGSNLSISFPFAFDDFPQFLDDIPYSFKVLDNQIAFFEIIDILHWRTFQQYHIHLSDF